MKILIRCLIMILTLCALKAQAEVLNSVWIVPEPLRQTHTHNNKMCISLFAPAFSLTTQSYHVDEQGNFIPKVTSSVEYSRPSQFDTVAEKILASWEQVHGYTSTENIEMLKQRDKNLDPLRTSYFYFENENKESVGIRVFDASDNVLKNQKTWTEVSPLTSAAPLEVSKPGFRLPGRNSGKPFYAWELGLLNADPELVRGTEFAFTQVAQLLDNNYNQNEFTFFGRTEKAQNLNMMIYAQTRTRQVSFFSRYGLKPVMEKDADGNERPVEVSPGMVLIAATAKDFITRNYGLRFFANRKGAPSRHEDVNIQQQIKQNQEYLSKLDQTKLNFTSPTEVEVVRKKLLEVLNSAKRDPPGFQIQGEKLAVFMSTYFRVVNSLPEAWRDSNWSNLRQILLSGLCQTSPQLAYYYLYSNLTRSEQPNIENSFTPEAEQNFFRHFPIFDRLPMPVRIEIQGWVNQ